MFELKKKKEENVTENEDHEYKIIVQRTQNDHDYNVYDINNESIKLISNNEIIEREKNFSLIKFSNERFFST